MKKTLARIFALLLIFGSFSGLVVQNLSGFNNPNLSLEFQGGYEMLVQVDSTSLIQESHLSDVAAAISNRVDILGVKNPQIDVEPELNAIRVTLAGLNTETERREAEILVQRQGQLGFYNVNGDLLLNSSVVESNGASLTYDQTGNPVVSLRIRDNEKFAAETKKLAALEAPNNYLVTWIDFEEAKQLHLEIEGRYPSNQEMFNYAVRTLDGTNYEYIIHTMKPFLASYATVQQELTGDATISGSFSDKEARQLAELINAGSFTYNLKLIETNEVPASYGAEAFNASVTAGMIGFIAISVFMILIYGLFGLISATTLGIYIVTTLIVFNTIGGEYGPDSIAALVIGLGMAVDANIITFERIKDELYKGRKLSTSIIQGGKKTMSTILDSNITTFIAGYLLFTFGTRSVKGFSIMLILSIFFTLFITVTITRVLINLTMKNEKCEKLINFKGGRLLGIKSSEIKETAEHELSEDRVFKDKNILKHGNKFAFVSLFVLFAGTIFYAIGGLRTSVEFSGGTRVTLEAGKNGTISEANHDVLRQKLEEVNNITISETFVAKTKDENGNEKFTFVYVIKETIEVNSLMEDELKDFMLNNNLEEVSRSSISPQVATQLTNNAIKATAIASLFIILYVSIRFKWSYAIAAVVALLHDVLMVVAIFSIFRIEINLSFISAILAIIGYSINDTIVTFDRTREIVGDMEVGSKTKKELSWAINKALKQTIVRSFFTTVTTLLAILALLFFGSAASQTFNIALFVGLIIGTYSSFFIASKIWILLESLRQKRLAAEKPRLPVLEGVQEQVFPGLND